MAGLQFFILTKILEVYILIAIQSRNHEIDKQACKYILLCFNQNNYSFFLYMLIDSKIA